MAKTCLQWFSTHKLVVFLAVLSLCLFISTLTLALTPKNQKQLVENKATSPWKLSNAETPKNYRLPRNIIPKNYNLTLWPHVSHKTFHGVVRITVKVVKPTKEIVFHSSKRISINNLTVQNGNETLVTVKDIKPDETEKLHVLMRKVLSYGFYEILISYTGRLDNNFVAFYSSVLENGAAKQTPYILKGKGLLFSTTKSLLFNTGKMQNLPKVRLSERLTHRVKPVNYKLKLVPRMDEANFLGNVDISIKVKEERKYLTLHSKFLDIKDVKILKSGKEVPVSKFVEVKQVEQLLIYCDEILSTGDYNVVIDFVGSLTNNHVGFYLSLLEGDRSMVASKFEPTYARQAYPCFDEPDFKATYDITLVKPASYVALSNMPEISSVADDTSSSVAVTFARSVPMSTYLACFVICDFVYKESPINASGVGNNFVLRAFSQKGETQKIDFALDIGKRATEFYIQYYEVPFPLPKLDMIAIPDYVSGATEHWGLITFRETSFLVDQATASARNKIGVANTVAHELAHMWFGNLVTMKWWDDLWLNEGFATYMQVKSLNALEPSWTMLDQFLTKTLHPVLVTDAKLSSHPIVQTVDTPDQITAIFDAISYNKGASVLRMLEGCLGEENFRKGISEYLKKYEFGNTVTQDLLNILDPYFKAANPNLNITDVLGSWTQQMGYPVVTVAATDDPTVIQLTQERFLLDPDAVYQNDSSYKYRWFVPFTYKTNNEIHSDVGWLLTRDEGLKIPLKSGEEWIKINNNQVGYYRVNYSEKLWAKLIELLKAKSPQLTISDRSQLLDDIFALAEARRVPYELALNLTTYISVDEDFVPWETAASVFAGLASRLRHSDAYDDLQKFIQSLVTPLYERQSWDSQEGSVIQRLLRTRILSLTCQYGLRKAEASVRARFTKWLDSHDAGKPIAVEPDLRDLVYFQGMKGATKAEWEKVWAIYLKEKDVHEQLKLRRALSAPRDTTILRHYLTLSWNESFVRSQDYLTVLGYISDNPSGTALVWDDVRARWAKLVDRFSLNSRYLGNLIPSITHTFNTDIKLKEMESFFEQYPEAGAGVAARRRALENVNNNIKWTKNYEPAVAKWLRNYVETASAN